MMAVLVVVFFLWALLELGEGRWEWLASYLIAYALGGIDAVVLALPAIVLCFAVPQKLN